MWGHEFVASVAGMLLSLMAPIANTALVAPSTGGLDCGLWLSQSGVSAGTSVQLTWWTMNAAQATLVDGTSGSTNVALSGSVAFTPSSSRTYTLIARNAQGLTKSCTANITVSPSSSAVPSCGISASPGVHYAGQPLQLVWYSQNATAAQISNLGTIPPSQLAQGTATVAPSQTTLYTMQVANASASRTCSALVTISPRPGTTQTSYSSPAYTPQTSYVYRPTTYTTAPRTTYSPSYSSPSYSSYSPYSSRNNSSYTTYESWDTWDTPYQSSGLGDYTLTNIWNGVGSGDVAFTNHDCYGSYCTALPTSWGAAYDNGTYMYGIGDARGNGASATVDAYGSLVGYGYTPSEAESNAALGDPRYQWTSDSSFPQSSYPSLDAVSGGISSQPEIQTFTPDVSVPGIDYYSAPGVSSGLPANSPFDYYTPTSYDMNSSVETYPELQSYQGNWYTPALQNNESNYYSYPTDADNNLQFDP